MIRRAFTLIELLVVISIISLLASVVLASLNSARDKGQLAAGKQFFSSIDSALGDKAIGWWDFDECSGSTAGDKSGSGNSAALQNSPAWSSSVTPLGIGCSLFFNGVNQYLIGTQSISSLVSSSFTVSAWAKRMSTGVNNFILSVGNTPTTNLLLHFGFRNTNVFSCAFYSNDLDTSTTYTDSNWHLWTCVYDVSANKRSLYRDGVLIGSDVPSSPFLGSGNLDIGAALGGSMFSGYIDNVRIYLSPLTASEIGKMYAVESPRFKLAER